MFQSNIEIDGVVSRVLNYTFFADNVIVDLKVNCNSAKTYRIWVMMRVVAGMKKSSTLSNCLPTG